MRIRILLYAICASVLASGALISADPALARDAAIKNPELDRVAYAVDGAESNHGRNASMWRTDLEGPQGPMQVSEKAAKDVGGGNRFDIAQNRALGRAYLVLLHRRYGNWPDAISAYNWGMGNLDGWIRAARPSDRLVPGVLVYLRRVLRESGVCQLENCQSQLARISRVGHRLNGWGAWAPSGSSDHLFLPGMEQSGRPLPRLAGSGRPLPIMGQSGRALPGLEQSGRPLPSLARAGRIL